MYLNSSKKKMIEPISIILLTFNRLRLSKKTIDSLYERIKTPFKLIIVDNASQDETREYLIKLSKEKGNIKLILLDKPLNICMAYNKGFEQVESELFITMQDDIIVPDLEPDVVQQLISLMNKYPDHGGIACRIQHIPNIKWLEGDLTPGRKALSAYFRIQKKEDIIKMGGFGDRSWDDMEFMKRMRDGINKKCSWANNLWCNHTGHSPDRGYNKFQRPWGMRIVGSNAITALRKYPEVDLKTNIPI